MKKRISSPRSKSIRRTGSRAISTNSSGINRHTAGIDIGAERHYVAVPETSSHQPVHEFSDFTKDLYAIADWLAACGVTTVAMSETMSHRRLLGVAL